MFTTQYIPKFVCSVSHLWQQIVDHMVFICFYLFMFVFICLNAETEKIVVNKCTTREYQEIHFMNKRLILTALNSIHSQVAFRVKLKRIEAFTEYFSAENVYFFIHGGTLYTSWKTRDGRRCNLLSNTIDLHLDFYL